MSLRSAAVLVLLSWAVALPVRAQEATAPAAADAPAAEAPVEMPLLEVIGKPEAQRRIPGSAQVLDHDTLSASHVFTTNEALRKIAGVNVRDEEGFGLRPNIGIRGLNPTRSTKVLLLEDGIPLAFAPYGDNASYYHPPVERFDRIEVLKGAGQNIYGPQTVGGVINYITPAPPRDFASVVSITGGNREYFNGRAAIGGNGMLLDLTRKQGDGARDNVHSEVNDVNFKAVLGAFGSHAFTARANYYAEDSQVAYTGLTDAEFENFGARYNPFENDEFETNRQGASVTHEWTLGRDRAVITNLYASRFERDWWRQLSTTSDSFCNTVTYDTAAGAGRPFQQARADGFAVDPDDCARNIGNLRTYYSYGVEPRLRLAHGLFGATNELETGLRLHFEEQERIGKTGSAADARSGTTNREDNERINQAYSAFVQNRFGFGGFSVTPGLRIEHVRYERTNACPVTTPSCSGSPITGTEELTEVLPSLGITREFRSLTVFAGVHRGFAPPRTEDIISNTTGDSVDVDAEESWNTELGLRGRPMPGVSYEATAFRNDFHRQIAVGSIAAGGVPLATGKTLYEGAELVGRVEFGRVWDTTHNPFVQVAYTWLPTARSSEPFECLVVSGTCTAVGMAIPGSESGKRIPYAPRNTATATLGYNHPVGLDARIESVFIDEQFADFANTRDAPANGNGQIGEIASSVVWNAAVSYKLLRPELTFFVTGKNVFDKEYIVDRTRGILPGLPRLVQAGVEYRF